MVKTSRLRNVRSRRTNLMTPASGTENSRGSDALECRLVLGRTASRGRYWRK
jgi:hypothetical protein